MPGRDNLYSQGDGPPRPQPSGRFRYPSNRQLALAAKSDIEEVTRQSLEAKVEKKDMPREKLKTSRDATSQLLSQLGAVSGSGLVKASYTADDPRQTAKSKISHKAVIPVAKHASGARFDIKRVGQDNATTTLNDVTSLPAQALVSGADTNNTNLAVLVQGSQMGAYDDLILNAMQQANLPPPAEIRRHLVSAATRRTSSLPPPPPRGKPAILSCAGTLQPAVMADRKVAPPKRRSRLRPVTSKRETTEAATNTANDEITGTADGVMTGDDPADPADPMEDGVVTSRRASSSHTVKSTKDLLEEARQLTSPSTGSLHVRCKDGDEPSSVSSMFKVASHVTSVEKWKTATAHKAGRGDVRRGAKGDVIAPAERTVDEIIASLQQPETEKILSASHRRIQAIMDSVLKRTVPTPPVAEEETSQPAEVEERQLTPVDEPKAPSPEDSRPQNELLIKSAHESDIVSDHHTSPPRLLTASTPAASKSLLQRALDELAESGTEQAADDSDNETDDSYDLEQAWRDLALPQTVSHADVLHVAASSSHLHVRASLPSLLPTHVSHLGTWPDSVSVPTGSRSATQTIHHLCVQRDAHPLAGDGRDVWRRYHAPGRHGGTRPFQLTSDEDEALLSPRGRPLDKRSSASLPPPSVSVTEVGAPAGSTAAMLDAISDVSLRDWQQRAIAAVNESLVGIEGQKVLLQVPDASLLYWSPAPPKWQLSPAQVRDTLFPHYRPLLAADRTAGTLDADLQSMASSPRKGTAASGGEEEGEEEEEEMTARSRFISRRYHSSRDLSRLMTSQAAYDERLRAARLVVPASVADTGSSGQHGPRPSRLSSAQQREPLSTRTIDTQFVISPRPDDVIDCPRPRRRTQSGPAGIDREDDDFLMIYQEFTGIIDELVKQRKQLAEMSIVQNADGEHVLVAPSREEHTIIEEEVVLPPDDTDQSKDDAKSSTGISRFESKSKLRKSPAEKAFDAGNTFVILARKTRSKKDRKTVDKKRIELIEKFKAARPRDIQRSVSTRQPRVKVAREFLVPENLRSTRRGSLGPRLDFTEYRAAKSKKHPNDDDLDDRNWVRSIWNRWFDTTFPATPPESEWGNSETESIPQSDLSESGQLKPVDVVYPDTIEVAPIVEDLEDEECIEMLEEEIGRISKVTEATLSAFERCRRGAILRKLGRVKPALDDLNAAIKAEPLMLNAYWHRHLVYMLQNRYQPALDDLAFILKHNKKNAQAYRSRAFIYKQQSDSTMAIINFSQVIKLCPQDDEAFFQRAEMYEKQGDVLLAMEDYSIVTRLNPGKTEALFRHGMHYYRNGTWNSAIKDLTELADQDPVDPRARLYRGLAFIQLERWADALNDLTAAIHLDPANPVPFYHRACLLRKSCPARALMDYSVSLLLDDSLNNINAYLHRGILYNTVGRHLDAIADFEALLKIDQDVACAHCMLGLIYMLNVKNIHRAVKKFSNAIKSDPTYIKAYICRAEAYIMLSDYQNALLDFTRAIHLKPDVQDYYMYRGEMLMKLGRLDLAAFCVRHAAALKTDLRGSAMQQAIVQMFLNNHDKAIEALTTALRSSHTVPLYTLLGKTQMKARLWGAAISSIESALTIMEPPNERVAWPAEAAEMFYLKGTCHKEMMNFGEAQDAFNETIRVQPKYAEAYYQRGLARLRLRQSKAGIQDLNKALSLDPTLYQVYLSRAAYYGLRSRYTKAILNCNEAARLQPNSIRAYLYRGALKYHIKAYQLAILDLTKAISFDNKCTLAYFNRAICHKETGEWSKALQDYGIVMLLGDDLLLKALVNRSLLYFEQRDYHNALCDLLMATRLSPNDKRIHHTLGRCYHELNRLQQAVHSFTRALELDQFFFDALIARGNTFMDFGHKTGHRVAKHDYERVLRLLPQCLAARVNLAINLQMSGRHQQAWRQLTTVIELDPVYQPALEGRAVVNLQMGDTYAAFQDISASVRVRPTAELLTNRGVVQQFMNDRVNAMHDFHRAIDLDPTFALAYFNAANIYFHMRQFAQARDFYEKACELNAKDEAAYLNNAITKVMLRDTPGALRDFKRAAELSPHSAHIYMNRANLYASIDRHQEAEDDYTTALLEKPDDIAVLLLRGEARGKLGKREAAIADYRRAVELQQ